MSIPPSPPLLASPSFSSSNAHATFVLSEQSTCPAPPLPLLHFPIPLLLPLIQIPPPSSYSRPHTHTHTCTHTKVKISDRKNSISRLVAGDLLSAPTRLCWLLFLPVTSQRYTHTGTGKPKHFGSLTPQVFSHSCFWTTGQVS